METSSGSCGGTGYDGRKGEEEEWISKGGRRERPSGCKGELEERQEELVLLVWSGETEREVDINTGPKSSKG